jgi:ribosomal protein S18 acetylase RimI-like enzyme
VIQPLTEHLLGAPLRDHQEVGVRDSRLRRSRRQLQVGGELAAGVEADPVVGAAQLERPRGNAQVVEHLEAARLQPLAAGSDVERGDAIDDATVDVAPQQLTAQCQAGRTRSDDEHASVGRGHGDLLSPGWAHRAEDADRALTFAWRRLGTMWRIRAKTASRTAAHGYGMTDGGRRGIDGPQRAPVCVVFRRLHGEAECALASRLLSDSGLQPAHVDARALTWFGLWDLGIADGENLVGAAIIGWLGPATAQLRAVAVASNMRRRGFGSRLVREVADAVCTEGASYLAAAVMSGDVPALRLLQAAGFTPAQREQQDGCGWLRLEL